MTLSFVYRLLGGKGQRRTRDLTVGQVAAQPSRDPRGAHPGANTPMGGVQLRKWLRSHQASHSRRKGPLTKILGGLSGHECGRTGEMELSALDISPCALGMVPAHRDESKPRMHRADSTHPHMSSS